ncbi:MAG: amino acid permease, partial [Firmicutes bacterium]|nr:amino acid permease [Bacillota bacterium]
FGEVAYAVGAVAVLTVINIIGVREGKWTQNLLPVVKAMGLLAIVGVAIFTPVEPGAAAKTAEATIPVSLALIFVLFTFGGWNEMAYVAAEVHNPRRNIVRALVLGTVGVTVLYLLVNAAFLRTLGFGGMATSNAVATDTVAAAFPDFAARVISVLICISALGAVNGLIFTGSRISYAVGADHPVFALLGKWNEQTATPVRALIVQLAIAIGIIVGLGSFIDAIIYTSPAVYSFYIATCLAVIILRFREPQVERPFRIPLFPLPVVVFLLACALLLRSAMNYKPDLAVLALTITMMGLPIYALSTFLFGKPSNDSFRD